MKLQFISAVYTLIIAFISYVITITFAGWFESLIAKKMGDDVPEQMGFLTLNPLEHFNVFGFAALLWGEFYSNVLPFQLIPGWGRFIPLVPDNIHGRYYKLRIFTEYVSRSGAHFIILLCSATSLMILCGAEHVYRLQPIISGPVTSFDVVLISLLSFIIKQNIILFVIHFVIGMFKYLMYFHMPRLQDISIMTMIYSFIALVIGLTIFSPLLEYLVLYTTESIRSLLLMLMK
jgi:hypothetical protein